jgi:hypothetical protein
MNSRSVPQEGKMEDEGEGEETGPRVGEYELSLRNLGRRMDGTDGETRQRDAL